jgi:DNA-binding response OmpR family regulator
MQAYPLHIEETMASRILVVDDERIVTEVVERYLQLEGYEVRVAKDGKQALEIAGQWHPDLIVLDLMLPEVDGLEVCRRLNRDSPLPIIMLTAKGEETDRIVGLELGADDYIVKPFSPRAIPACLLFLSCLPPRIYLFQYYPVTQTPLLQHFSKPERLLP